MAGESRLALTPAMCQEWLPPKCQQSEWQCRAKLLATASVVVVSRIRVRIRGGSFLYDFSQTFIHKEGEDDEKEVKTKLDPAFKPGGGGSGTEMRLAPDWQVIFYNTGQGQGEDRQLAETSWPRPGSGEVDRGTAEEIPLDGTWFIREGKQGWTIGKNNSKTA